MSTVTLKDVARECGVSFSSVSRALKGSPEIGQATIKLVVETAANSFFNFFILKNSLLMFFI